MRDSASMNTRLAAVVLGSLFVVGPSLAGPPAVPGVVLGGLRAERLADRADGCDVPRCVRGDDLCRQLAFEAAVECAESGRLAGGDSPTAGTSLFFARGGGVTLYGALGPAGGGHEALLRGVRRVVER